MSGEDSKVMVIYAHDDEGRTVALPLIESLRGCGVNVICDLDLKFANVTSIVQWMHQNIVEYPVICVLSQAVVDAFRDRDSPEHQGIIFEIRTLLMKLYRHTGPDKCPIIPVAAQEFSADRVPHALASMEISRFEPATRRGTSGIVKRLADLDVGVVGNLRSADQVSESSHHDRRPKDVLLDLEMIDPSSASAPTLVREWLAMCARDAGSAAHITDTFPMFERIVKASGDLGLMRELAERCIEMLDDGDLPDTDKRTKAQVLICGRSWYLRRQRNFRRALDATMQGIRLATECHDIWVVALGERCSARIHRAMAEDSEEGDECRRHLDAAMEHADAAIRLFNAMNQSHELAICASVVADIHFTRYRLCGDRRALRQASDQADHAVRYLTPDLVRAYLELSILRAEIAIASRFLPRAGELLDKVLPSLEGHRGDGASYAKLLGRAYLTRAKLDLGKRKCRRHIASAIKDTRTALEIFSRLGLYRSVAECEWSLTILTGDPVRVSRRNGSILSSMCPNPEIRMLALHEYKRRKDEGACPFWTRRSEWRDIIDTVRARQR